MWIFTHILKKPDRPELWSRFSLRKERKKYPEGKLKSYCAVVSHLFEEYFSEEIITGTTAEINLWKQQNGQTETILPQKL